MRNHRGHRSWRAVVLVAFFLVTAGASRANATLIGILEGPSGVASGAGGIFGWVYTTVEGAFILSPIEVFIDGVKAYEVPCCAGRGDVQAARPDAPFDTGYSGPYNWGLLEPGMHDVDVVVKSSAAETKTFSVKITTVRVGDQSFLTRLRFTEDSDCTHGNDSPDGDNASIRCTGMLAEKKDGADAFLCLGTLIISWDKATQSFKITTDCEPEPPCSKDSDCDDGVFCNGIESCDVGSGSCVALSSCPPFLDGCVIRGGLCDEATDSCLDLPDDIACDDGVFCNGIESCNVVTGGCAVLGSCPQFLDGCVTRNGICDEATDTCFDDPDDSLCDDGLFCTGPEACDAVSGGCTVISACPPTFPTGCVTPNALCDEPTDMCLDDLDDSLCPIGQTCQPDGSCSS